ncbi:MAG: hypothetical protein GY719_41965 [bacterium]|nr:hypothetical protein [bacterium]
MSSDRNPKRGLGEESTRRIRLALQAELYASRRAKEVDAGIGYSSGYLYKFCRGETTAQVGSFMQALELLDLDPGRFFANALSAPVSNDEMLREVEEIGEVDKRLVNLEKATTRLKSTPIAEGRLREVDAEALVAKMAGCRGVEQRRRLRQGQRYRQPAFAHAYLEHLDAFRYDDPKLAARNAEEVAVKMIHRLPVPRPERMALQLKALGVFGSAHRLVGGFSTAARAARIGLSHSRMHRLSRTTADLLQRGAYALSDHGRFAEAMKLLEEALVIYFDLDSQRGLGQVMVDRGLMLTYLGKHRASLTATRTALRLLPNTTPRDARNQLAALEVQGLAYKGLGDIENAEESLRLAVEKSDGLGEINRAKLLWQHGCLAFARKIFPVAEHHLRRAREVFDRVKGPEKALVSLDLAEVLVAQGDLATAAQLALTMARYLKTFSKNKMAQAGISEFMRIAVSGNLTLSCIGELRKKLETEKIRLLNERS